jgi:hypothetical protein
VKNKTAPARKRDLSDKEIDAIINRVILVAALQKLVFSLRSTQQMRKYSARHG